MRAEEKLQSKLARFHRWAELCDRLVQKETSALEQLMRESISDLESQKSQAIEALQLEEVRVQGEMDQAGKDYAKTKYQMERDSALQKNDIKRLNEEMQDFQKKTNQELTRLSEEKTQVKISFDRQISALNDLYQEKRRHLTVAKAGLVRECQILEEKLRNIKTSYQEKLDAVSSDGNKKINHLKQQSAAKREGWTIALDAMKKEMEALSTEKSGLEKKVSEIHLEKEKELEAARVEMAIAREQLEIDKATLIEKAEDEQRKTEADVNDLKEKIESSGKELQDLVVRSEQVKRDTEEAFLREENMLKETLKSEADKRDYEQKLFEQEKSQKEKEINALREEFEKRKWHWDNQIRSLLMQKSVQDSEHEAVRIRVDREARTVLRSLEAKRDEMKQRLSDIKTRHKVLSENSQKENDLIKQRWHWRRDRLWAMWQNRLDVLRKERAVLQEQIEAVHQKFSAEKKTISEAEQRDSKRTNDMQGFLMQSAENNNGQRKQREIQFELEKTRLFTQIKECENLLAEWMEKLKETEQDVRKNNNGLVEQMGYLDRWYREEEAETQLFLQNLQMALTTLEGILSHQGLRDANAA